MIRSMTGYGRAEMASPRLSLSVECKSLNHRHLDIALKLPRSLSALELDARRIIQAAVQRGRIEVSVVSRPSRARPRPISSSTCRRLGRTWTWPGASATT